VNPRPALQSEYFLKTEGEGEGTKPLPKGQLLTCVLATGKRRKGKVAVEKGRCNRKRVLLGEREVTLFLRERTLASLSKRQRGKG